MKIPSSLDPNKELATSSIVWYCAAMLLMAVALGICFAGCWQTNGFVRAGYDAAGNLISEDVVSKANTFSVRPQLTTVIWAILLYGAMIARRYIRNISNLPTLILVAANILFIGSLIESFVPAQSICLFKIFKWEIINISPQKFLIAAVMFAWVGMRALSGGAIVVVGIAFLSHAQELNIQLGLYGTFFVLSGFMSLLVQARLPYMVPEGGWCASLLEDFGAVRIAAAANVKALGETVANASASAKGAIKIGAS